MSWLADPMLADRVCRPVGLGCSVLLTAAALALRGGQDSRQTAANYRRLCLQVPGQGGTGGRRKPDCRFH